MFRSRLSSGRGELVFPLVDSDETLHGTTRSFSQAINYTREANLSESIIIAARQNYVLTPGTPPLFAAFAP